MKNRPADLNNHMFAMLEVLSDEDLSGDELKAACTRAGAMAKVGTVIVNNYRVSIEAQKVSQDREVRLPDFLEDKTAKEEGKDHPVFLLRRDA